MMRIEIPFNEWSRERLYHGQKTATSRNKKYGVTGDSFRIDDIDYELDIVMELPLWFVTSELFISEGADTPEEFIDVWKQTHPSKGYVPEQKVWYHHFKYS